jgi:hypothetical protein
VPTEVLVMCKGCGRPQQAAQRSCPACGALLPDAPLPAPSAPEPPFLDVDLGGGRHLSGSDGRLTFRGDAVAAPVLVELGNLQDVALKHRPLHEAFGLAVAVAVALFFVPALRPLALIPVPLVGLALAAAWRRYTLVLTVSGSPPIRWALGLVRRGSAREERLFQGFIRLSEVLHARERRPGVPRA